MHILKKQLNTELFYKNINIFINIYKNTGTFLYTLYTSTFLYILLKYNSLQLLTYINRLHFTLNTLVLFSKKPIISLRLKNKHQHLLKFL